MSTALIASREASSTPTEAAQSVSASHPSTRSDSPQSRANFASKRSVKSSPEGLLKQQPDASPIKSLDKTHHGKATTATMSFLRQQPRSDLLPEEARRILQEVAQTGSSSQLSWSAGPQHTAAAAAPLPDPGRHARTNSYNSLLLRRPANAPPPRKKPRNGLHPRPSNRRLTDAGGKKRPLVLTPSAMSPAGSSAGSEPEDTVYECDSEGTSTTSISELSMGRDRVHRNVIRTTPHPSTEVPPYASLREVFRVGVSTVLEHYYHSRGGYKLAPAEKGKLKKATDGSLAAKANAENIAGDAGKKQEERIFKQRLQRLLAALGEPSSGRTRDPPFTIQRVAEVLLHPTRYYTKTHKLCNCLEKLLLVTSSTNAFGGSTGGDTSQSRREAREIAALADEKGRLQSQLRQRRLQRRASSASSASEEEFASESKSPDRPTEMAASQQVKREGVAGDEGGKEAEPKDDDEGGTDSDREILEAAARASLRTKFDHVGMDPHHHHHGVTTGAGNNRDVRMMAESRGLTNSPPPPSLATAGIGLAGHLRTHDQDHHRTTPILFNSAASNHDVGGHHNNPSIHLLQVNHAAAVAGLTPLELMNVASESSPGASSFQNRDLDVESRSSASSDVDSESDDVSFDDSASDRSDGSDHEPFSAARALALSRQQQQRRLQQTRHMLSSLHHGSQETEQDGGAALLDDSGESDSSASDITE